MSNPNIIIIPSWTPSDKNRSAGVFIYEQAKLLSDRGLNVSIFQIQSEGYSLFGKGSNRTEKQTNDGVCVYTLNTKTVPKVGSIMINRWASLYDDIYLAFKSENSERPIIHAHGYIAGFAARRLSEKHNTSFVITEHGTSIINQSYKWWHKKEIVKTYNQADQCIAVGKLLANQMKKIANVAIQTIPNLVDEDIFYPRKSPVSATFEFICVGGLDKRKRIDAVIHAFSEASIQLKDKSVTLRIIGDGKELNTLLSKTDNFGLTDKVIFDKELPLEKVAEKMRNANAFITVSKMETFGKVIVEALASGIPVIASRSADPEEIVRSKNGIKIENDLKQLPKAMIQMTQEAHAYNPDVLHKQVIESYGKEVVLNQIIEIYERILTRP